MIGKAKQAAGAIRRTANREVSKARNQAIGLTAQRLGPDSVYDDRGEVSMERGINLVVTILVVGILVANLLPMVLDELNAADTTSWGSAEAALFGLLGLFFILAIVLYVIDKAT